MSNSGRKTAAAFAVAFLVALACFGLGIVQNNAYNSAQHQESFTGTGLFAPEGSLPDGAKEKPVYVSANARSSTWTKVFDFNNEGLTEHNYQAYTYDFTVANNTDDQVKDFAFKLSFSKDVYLAQAWNGALEIHQHVNGEEVVETIPDLREFDPADYSLQMVTVDGETLVSMKPGDYLVYIPSSSMNAMEVPIEAHEATTPGIILYAAIGDSIDDSTLDLRYMFNRALTAEPFFWAALIILGVWLVALISFGVTSAHVKKYKVRHERDNVIINECIETFTGFVDAKDPNTTGHSKRVATYTKLIAQELGYEGEKLDRIYYVAMLHDCGKIGIPDNILGKPGKLTDEEYETIKEHTLIGSDILQSFKSLENVGEGARYHHERYDGKGYPEGLAGEDIPFIGRLICVADSFDVMNSNRIYREKLTKEQLINEIEANKGTQFDPKIADILLRLIREGKIVVDDVE